MIVCHCLSITDRDLKRAASQSQPGNGLGLVRRAGSCCGSCKPMLRKLLQDYSAKKSIDERAEPSK